jgi:hypothetical protein
MKKDNCGEAKASVTISEKTIRDSPRRACGEIKVNIARGVMGGAQSCFC